jgi:hypothetical protein
VTVLLYFIHLYMRFRADVCMLRPLTCGVPYYDRAYRSPPAALYPVSFAGMGRTYMTWPPQTRPNEADSALPYWCTPFHNREPVENACSRPDSHGYQSCARSRGRDKSFRRACISEPQRDQAVEFLKGQVSNTVKVHDALHSPYSTNDTDSPCSPVA